MAKRVDTGWFVTADLIRSLSPDIQPSTNLDPYIASAHTLVWSTIIANGCGANYTDEQLKWIEAWLAVHFHHVQNGILSSQSAGGASESYQMNTDFLFYNTMPGQQALLFDTNGCLATLLGTIEDAKTSQNKKRVTFAWLGRPGR
jgi:hypothetical protein